MAMKPCKCGKNKWTYRFFDETRIVRATCLGCGAIVEFKAKPRKPYDPNKVEACAEYEIRDGKHFLKINGQYKRVEVLKVTKNGRVNAYGKYLRVMPV